MARLSLTPAEKAKVTRAIASAEQQTSGEIVVVATRQSDDYLHAPLHLAAALALAVPLLVPLIAYLVPWAAVSFWLLYLIQLLTFIIIAGVLSLPTLRYWITPRALMRKYAHRNATSQFLTRNMHTTKGRSGVLIFVSLLERYVEIIGDTEISAKVSANTWQDIISQMLPLLTEDKLDDALVLGVERAGDLLASHFPPGADNPNELPDHLIVLD